MSKHSFKRKLSPLPAGLVKYLKQKHVKRKFFTSRSGIRYMIFVTPKGTHQIIRASRWEASAA